MAKPQRETGHRAVLEAGYSPKNPDQSAYQAMKQIGERLREVMDRLGLTDEHAYQAMKAVNDRARDVLDAKGFTLEQLIEKHLRSKLEARETKFFPWRKTSKRKTELIIDSREVAALAIRLGALDVAFRLCGDYAPKKLDFDPDEGVPIKVINLGGILRHNA